MRALGILRRRSAPQNDRSFNVYMACNYIVKVQEEVCFILVRASWMKTKLVESCPPAVGSAGQAAWELRDKPGVKEVGGGEDPETAALEGNGDGAPATSVGQASRACWGSKPPRWRRSLKRV